jgi:hypothetical protein
MLSIVGWWAIPAGALTLVVLWAAWHSRTRRPQGMRETTAHYERFQAVLTRVVAADPSGESGAAPDRREPHNPNGSPPRAAGRRNVP